MRNFLLILSCLLILFPITLFPDSFEKSLHEILKGGTLEELKEACRVRYLSDEGGPLDLQRRLLEYEFNKGFPQVDERVAVGDMEEIILNHADFIEYQEDEEGDEIIFLRGNVDIEYAAKKITADQVNINVDTGIITGVGNITFISQGKEYWAESFYYNSSTDEGLFINAKTYISKFFYKGGIIWKVHESEKFVAEDVTLTTCDLDDPHYRIESDKLYFYDENRVLIKDASIYYGSEKVMRLPYLYKNLNEPVIRSSLYFRERAGIVSQNTYYPLETDEKELKLKGDFYERLGLYIGSDFSAIYPSGGSTQIGVSAALSNDVYRYEDVTEEWSPYGPPGDPDFSINRDLRYKLALYQMINFGTGYENETEFNIYWASDPYYAFDFERRKEKFDVFDLINQAEYDYPRKSSGFTWFVNNYFFYKYLSISIQNRLRFEPQRDTDEEFRFLPDYYEYRIYTLTTPDITVSHQKSILNGKRPEIFSDINYKSSASYSHTIYYDENGNLSSELHKANTLLNFNRDYLLSEFVLFTPEIEVGAQGQAHVEPDSSEELDDKQNSFLYGKAKENIKVGSSHIYLEMTHDLKYKFVGPDDEYVYGDFRIHELAIGGYAGWEIFTDYIRTSIDLRPTYDWERNRYKTFELDENRFSPLINTLTFKPFFVLSMRDRLIYDIADARFKTNSFDLNYESSAIYLWGREFFIQWNLDWEHNFVNPRLDILRSSFGLNARVHRYWELYLTVLSRNDDLWRYEKLGDPFVDLLKSFNFFNTEDREESLFKIKGISLGFIHDLHDWELRFDYTGNRQLSFDQSRYLWNNTYSISLGLKEIESLRIHTQYAERK
jgi:hypothetical protein